jgi:hypothetical protein
VIGGVPPLDGLVGPAGIARPVSADGESTGRELAAVAPSVVPDPPELSDDPPGVLPEPGVLAPGIGVPVDGVVGLGVEADVAVGPEVEVGAGAGVGRGVGIRVGRAVGRMVGSAVGGIGDRVGSGRMSRPTTTLREIGSPNPSLQSPCR